MESDMKSTVEVTPISTVVDRVEKAVAESLAYWRDQMLKAQVERDKAEKELAIVKERLEEVLSKTRGFGEQNGQISRSESPTYR